jgi:hypothetical protein
MAYNVPRICEAGDFLPKCFCNPKCNKKPESLKRAEKPRFCECAVIRSPFHLSVEDCFILTLSTYRLPTKAEQEAKLFGSLASVWWVLSACQCACLVVMVIQYFAYCLSLELLGIYNSFYFDNVIFIKR